MENKINIQEREKQIAEDVCNAICDMIQSRQSDMLTNFENCTDALQNAPKGGKPNGV